MPIVTPEEVSVRLTPERLDRLDGFASRFTASDKASADEARAAMPPRWHFGKEVLEVRGDRERLPNNEIKAITARTGVHRREIQYCEKFAEVYPTEADCDRAIHKYQSWTQLKRHGLYDPQPATRNPKVMERRARRWLAQLAGLDFSALTDPVDFGESLMALGRNAIALGQQNKEA